MRYDPFVRTAGQKLLEQLLTEDLSGVTFVRDYLQLQFNLPPMVNVYSRCRVVDGDTSVQFREAAFANSIIAQLGKQVVAVSDADEIFTITLEGGVRIEIPFGDGTFDGPEAFELWGRDQQSGVWPP